MAHHAFFWVGEQEAGIAAALRYAERDMKLSLTGNPDIIIERYGLLRVEDARRVGDKAALAPLKGSEKLYIIAASRIFHESQNAMLKLFEEPPAGTTLVLIVPSEGDLLYTLRSRLLPLPGETKETVLSEEVQEFIAGSSAAREKVVERILDDAKSDTDEDKQSARARALQLAEGLAQSGYAVWRKESGPDSRDKLQAFLTDLDRLIPVLHDRSAPLKPILEHLLITAPKKLS
ncbi:MAG TPA: hypothetical protein VHB93_01295 [Candidatus Paceibacterota bacterium]|nr:hypothetical protein [Candidatus Paceibacterota bacterium]